MLLPAIPLHQQICTVNMPYDYFTNQMINTVRNRFTPNQRDTVQFIETIVICIPQFWHNIPPHIPIGWVWLYRYSLVIFFSIVMQDAVNILCILPQRFLCFLKVSSSMELFENKSFNQLSVSTHSLRAILNFDNISGKLCGYWASVIFANTLEEDLRIWKIVF